MKPQQQQEPEASLAPVEGDTPNLFTSQEQQDLESDQATPQEQAQYDEIVTRMMSMIHDPQTGKSIVDAMKGGQRSVGSAVASAAEKLILFAKESSKAQGVEFAPEALREAFGKEIIPELVDVGEAEGLWELDEKEYEKAVQDSVMLATKRVGETMIRNGTIPQSEAQDFLSSQGVEVSDMIPEGLTPGAEGVARANQQIGMEAANGQQQQTQVI